MQISKRYVLLAALTACVSLLASGAIDAEIRLEKPAMRWLWGGFGFHNSEATMTPMMTQHRMVSTVSASNRLICQRLARRS